MNTQTETLKKNIMATKTKMDRHIWEGWTVRAFIKELAPQVEMIMSGQSWREPFRNKQELADWCRDNQPYYKKRIPEVNSQKKNARSCTGICISTFGRNGAR